MPCNGVCDQFRATKPSGGRYAAGQKRCQTCDIYMYYDGLCCPCCNVRLRVSSRYLKIKEREAALIRI